MIDYDVIIVGGGIAGLTAAAYLSKTNQSVCLFEKEAHLGGHIHTFLYHEHFFDSGIRSIESSGVLKPMISDLNLDVSLVKSPVTLGIKDDVISLNTRADMPSYEALLIKYFPNEKAAIKNIMKQINQILNHMDVLYGMDNPMIVDFKKRPTYALRLIPWMFKFIPTIFKINRLGEPVETYLKKYTDNQALIDIIAQHFFKATPTFFALGYFNIYFDYHYPLGGTGKLISALEQKIDDNHGHIIKNQAITKIDPIAHEIIDHQEQKYRYKKLIWAADLKSLYQQLDHIDSFKPNIRSNIQNKTMLIEKARGAESVLTVYMQTDLDPSYFDQIASAHFFYTPKTLGKHAQSFTDTLNQTQLFQQLKSLYDLETYEISIPALRDASLSPKGETGLIVSILFSYDLIKHIADLGYYDDFKKMTEKYFVEVLSMSIYPNLKDHIIDCFSSTPLTFKQRTNNTDGAMIGWAYDSKPIPVHHKMSKITKSIHTPIPDIYQAGQWSFSPAGVPISIITGKLAADRVKKELKAK